MQILTQRCNEHEEKLEELQEVLSSKSGEDGNGNSNQRLISVRQAIVQVKDDIKSMSLNLAMASALLLQLRQTRMKNKLAHAYHQKQRLAKKNVGRYRDKKRETDSESEDDK